jgi:hypothetical protein
VRRCVVTIARSTISDLQQQGIAEAAQLRAHADCFVIGMRHDNHHPLFERTAFGQILEDRIGSPDHPGAVDKPSGANPPPARQ